MRRALTKLLPEDHQSLETRSCKRRNNSERPSYQNVPVSVSSAAFFFDLFFAAVRAAHYRSAWKLVSFVTSFYGDEGAKFPAKSESIAVTSAREFPFATSPGSVAFPRPVDDFLSFPKQTPCKEKTRISYLAGSQLHSLLRGSLFPFCASFWQLRSLVSVEMT
jgi:hypothetical protein